MPEKSLPIDFPGASLGQIFEESDLPRIFVRQETRFDKILQFFGRRRIRNAVFEDNEGAKRHPPVRQFVRKHRAFQNIRMVSKAKLDLQRIDPLPRHLDEIISTAPERVKPVCIEIKTVAGPQPFTAHRFRRLVRAGTTAMGAHTSFSLLPAQFLAAMGHIDKGEAFRL